MNTVYDITTQSYKSAPELFSNNAKGHFSIAVLISAIEEMNNKMRDADNAFSVEQSVNEFNSANKILDEKADAAQKNKKKSIMTSAFAGINMAFTGFTALGSRSFEHGFKTETRKAHTLALKDYSKLSAQLYDIKYGGKNGSVMDIEERRELVLVAFKAEQGYDLLGGVRHQGMHKLSDNAGMVSGLITAGGEGVTVRVASGASADERQAELDGTFEHFFEKDADSYSSKARSVSQQTMQAVESLVGVLGKLQDAMTLK